MSRSRHKKYYVEIKDRGPYRAKWDMVHDDKRKKNKHKRAWLDELESLEVEGEELEEETSFHCEQEREQSTCASEN